MKWLLAYVRGTIKLPLTLQVDIVSVLKWWVDASYAIQHVMRRHTGGTISMGNNGQGSIIKMSKKQKLNTKRLTEEELIGADNVLPQLLWTRYFLKEKGYDIDENIMYQENMITILLYNNGRRSITKNTKNL